VSVALTASFDDAPALAAIAAVRARGEDLRPMWQAIGRAGVASTKRRFQSGRGPDGQTWKKGRKAQGKTLIASGLLLRSLTEHADQTGVEWGSNRIYAGVHQSGAVILPKNGKALRFKIAGGRFVTVKKVTIPARPYLGINAADRAAFIAIAQRHAGAPLGAAPAGSDPS
jgi:phage virion morphogenesis protein